MYFQNRNILNIIQPICILTQQKIKKSINIYNIIIFNNNHTTIIYINFGNCYQNSFYFME